MAMMLLRTNKPEKWATIDGTNIRIAAPREKGHSIGDRSG